MNNIPEEERAMLGYFNVAEGMWAYICPRCGQAGAKGNRCNSGLHQGPKDGNDGVEMVRSIDFVQGIERSLR